MTGKLDLMGDRYGCTGRGQEWLQLTMLLGSAALALPAAAQQQTIDQGREGTVLEEVTVTARALRRAPSGCAVCSKCDD